MEMYADPEARGGVLEPEGVVEIRFRAKDLIKAMLRNDPQCKELSELIAKTSDAAEKKTLEAQLNQRQQFLMRK